MYVLSLKDRETPEKFLKMKTRLKTNFAITFGPSGAPTLKKKGPAFCGKKNCTDSETLPETICPLHPKKKVLTQPCKDHLAIYSQVLIFSSSNINKGGFLFLKIIQNLPAWPCDGLQLGEICTSLGDTVNANR